MKGTPQMKITRSLATDVMSISLVGLLSFGIGSWVIAQTTGAGCVTGITCNETLADIDPPYCLATFSKCDTKAEAACNQAGSCGGSTFADYPNRVPTTCLTCTEAERNAGQICDCNHCRNNAPPLEPDAICYARWICWWDEDEEQEPKCKKFDVCLYIETGWKVNVDCRL